MKFKVINKQHTTANIGKLGKSANIKVSKQIKHINDLISGWLEKPSLPILANRYLSCCIIGNFLWTLKVILIQLRYI